VAEVNAFDVELFEFGQKLFCRRLRLHQTDSLPSLFDMPNVRKICEAALPGWSGANAGGVGVGVGGLGAGVGDDEEETELPPVRPPGYLTAQGVPKKQKPQVWK
jgi:hypothetical protein